MEKTIVKKVDANNPLSIGATIEGKVVARDRSSLFIDLGILGTGIIYGKEFYAVKDVIKSLNVGDKVFAKIIEVENDEGYRELSLRDATKEIGWQKLKELKDSGQIINVRVTGVNKGGLLTSIDGIQAFLPVSQLAPEHYPRVADADKQKILKELQKFIGKTLEVKILDLLATENKLILSEKPEPSEILSDLVILGRHILTPEVFEYLKKAKPSKKGEIILAEVLGKMLDDGKAIYGYELSGEWLECGDKLKWLKSFFYLCLKDARYKDELKQYLKTIK